jgi:hypothetical protein
VDLRVSAGKRSRLATTCVQRDQHLMPTHDDCSIIGVSAKAGCTRPHLLCADSRAQGHTHSECVDQLMWHPKSPSEQSRAAVAARWRRALLHASCVERPDVSGQVWRQCACNRASYTSAMSSVSYSRWLQACLDRVGSWQRGGCRRRCGQRALCGTVCAALIQTPAHQV